MRIKTGIAAVVAALALAGCGGTTKPAPRHYTEQQIVAALGENQYTTGWQAGSTGCTVIIALTTPADVALYTSAGDSVATNTAGTVGVKFEANGTASETDCLELFSDRLATLK